MRVCWESNKILDKEIEAQAQNAPLRTCRAIAWTAQKLALSDEPAQHQFFEPGLFPTD